VILGVKSDTNCSYAVVKDNQTKQSYYYPTRVCQFNMELSVYFSFDCNDTSFWYLEASDSGCIHHVKHFTYDISIYTVMECFYGNNSNYTTGSNVTNTSIPVSFNTTSTSPYNATYNLTYLSTLATYNNTIETTYFITTGLEFNQTYNATNGIYNNTLETTNYNLSNSSGNGIPQSGNNVSVLNSSLLCLNEPRIYIDLCVNRNNYKCFENDNNTNIECYLINDNPHNCTDNIGNSLVCYDVNNVTNVASSYITCLFQSYYSTHKRSSNNSNNFIYCNYISSNNNNSKSKLNWHLMKMIGLPVLAAIIILCCFLMFCCCCRECCCGKKATNEGKKCDNVVVNSNTTNTKCQDGVMV